ncbi:hypothetical protein [Persicobacter diffluens]|uniref:Transporter n=1 Tax=Persicobacter diffluens TaxID=981 RepID=A0AAN4W3Q3_9BACT|nr:hypothetical protein PEDI_51190 [Persicobacter diffluens]
MKKYFTSLVLTLIACSWASFTVLAQEADSTAAPINENEKIAKELVNPNTTLGLMAFPIDYVHYKGTAPGASSQNGLVINFQPSLPIPLSKSVNLFVRPLIPLHISQPTMGEQGFSQQGVNLGNISADVAVGKTWPSKFISILGVFGSFPTATVEALKAPHITLGPELMLAQLTDWGGIGLLVNHSWSVNSPGGVDAPLSPEYMWATNNGTEASSVTAGQYFYVVNLRNAWQITGQPTWAFNHKASKGNRLSLPLGTGVSKVTKFGKLPVKISLQYWYYVASPDMFGAQHQVRLQIAPVIPLPW